MRSYHMRYGIISLGMITGDDILYNMRRYFLRVALKLINHMRSYHIGQ
jgi:hypothetical protein